MSPDHGSSRSRRGVWSHWVPLAVTLTVATVGVAAWVWSQRKDGDDEDEHYGLDYGNQARTGDNQPHGSRDINSRDIQGPEKPPRPDGQSQGIAPADEDAAGGGWGSRMSGALRRTPSPQQFFDSTAPADTSSPLVGGNRRRKTVAIVVSAETGAVPEEEDSFHEHASILSHIPRNIDHSKVKLFVLIYAPGLKEPAMDTATIQTPAEESKNQLESASPSFNSIYSQALSLVEKETMVLPFTTPNGHVHILRHLQPEVIYLQKALSGQDGSIITTLQTWLRHDVILVVGADGGSGGLADSESEAERAGKSQEWWQRPERVGRGRGVVVVDSMRLNDDWARRVQGQE
ncbi:hypothetical protein FVEG_09663 [Fusarium verticillioides 7600]|uniref:Peroxin 22-like protein n=1 Tax=Gibberella moniliformis (strain M3125 / FGSC 7600) TaxID=334819 RepID=W7N146_GIBM7|nr:hypothetical protein FVEG_09663 [Fusarium verticillioides 7600]EWG50452.1 hypothetical protein FVEG_09663 [Fusarium verticillioides 7600]